MTTPLTINLTASLKTPEDKLKAIRSLEDLQRSDGWKLVLSWLIGQRQLNMEAMCKPDVETNTLHKLSGQTHLLNVILAWPDITLGVLRKQMEAQTKKENP